MRLKIIIVLTILTGITGSPSVTIRPEVESVDNKRSISEQQNLVTETDEIVEDVMATGELNPNHYPAQRAAKVVQHYINTLYGSPFKVFHLHRVHSGNAEDVADSGRKYQLEISVQEMISNTSGKCSAEVFFSRGDKQHSPQVQVMCEELLKINTTKEEDAFYQQLKKNTSLLSAEYLPDSHGHIEPDMKPLWHLASVASSFIMLNESTQDTLFNMAQVANVTQLATESDQLKFEYLILLHEMVSQEIIRWKLLVSWCPPEGVKVLQMEKLPHCHECEKPPNTN